MSPIRYRRTSLRTALGITKEEKRIKRDLGITEILKPFRWWGNEKRTVKRDLGYYSPGVRLARHLLPHSASKLLWLAMIVLGIPFVIGWVLKSSMDQKALAPPAASAESPTVGGIPSGSLR